MSDHSLSFHAIKTRCSEALGAMTHNSYFLHVLLFVIAYAAFTTYLKPHEQHNASLFALAAVEPVSVASKPTMATANVSSVAAVSTSPTIASPSPSVAQRVDATPEVIAAPANVEYASRIAPVVRLQRMVEDDELAENRLAAVRRLSAMAANGDQSANIQRVLQNASTDADESVAAAARAAYNELTARSQPRP